MKREINLVDETGRYRICNVIRGRLIEHDVCRALCFEEKINLIKEKEVVSRIDYWVNALQLLKMTNYYFLFSERINKFILNKHLFIEETIPNMGKLELEGEGEYSYYDAFRPC